MGAYAIGEEPQESLMEILLPRLDSLRKHAQLYFSFGSSLQPAPQAHNGLEALLGQGTLDFLHCFEIDTEKEISVKFKVFLGGKVDQRSY